MYSVIYTVQDSSHKPRVVLEHLHMTRMREKLGINCIEFYVRCEWLPISNGYFVDVHGFDVPLHCTVCAELAED